MQSNLIQGSFDTCLLLFVLHHIADSVETTLSEAARVAKRVSESHGEAGGKLLGAPGPTTRSKDATRGSWHRY